MTLALCVATMHHPSEPSTDLDTWCKKSSVWLRAYVQYNTPEENLGVVKSYQKLYVESTEDLLMFVHDDVICREEGWNVRIVDEFKDPKVGLVGLGGALQHGTPELYKVPYQLQQLRRSQYKSNVDDADVHGERFAGSCEVAVLDGFCLVVRRSFLDRIRGWQTLIDAKIDFIAYDYVLCALARRLGYKIRVVGVRCHHRGGSTSTKVSINRNAEYEYAHQWCYENLRDVLPARVI